MPLHIHPAFEHLRAEFEARYEKSREAEAKVVKAPEKDEPTTSDAEVETR